MRGIPYTVCEKCWLIISKYNDIREDHNRTLMESRGRQRIDFDGDDDVTDMLNSVAEKIFRIESELEFMKNCLFNIHTDTRRSFNGV